jgi:hypothetical protein
VKIEKKLSAVEMQRTVGLPVENAAGSFLRCAINGRKKC